MIHHIFRKRRKLRQQNQKRIKRKILHLAPLLVQDTDYRKCRLTSIWSKEN
uniref:Uncharacterized protein n=1 Tax=Arundo donax TaxID=35708 RepID=A0A0A8Z070_ARUDO